MLNKTSVIILAGGFGTRTKSLLGGTPKILIETSDGETVLSHMLQDIDNNSLSVSIITNGLFYDQINKVVQEKYSDKKITIINNYKMIPEERLGALGDLLLAIEKTKAVNNEILVLPSDTAYWQSFLIKDVLDFANDHKDSFITVVYDVGDKEKIKNNLGCVTLGENPEIIEFEEKPEEPKSTLAIVAIYLFRPEHVEFLKAFKKEGGDLNSPSNIIPYLMKKEVKISAYLSKGKVVDANSPEQISEAKKY